MVRAAAVLGAVLALLLAPVAIASPGPTTPVPGPPTTPIATPVPASSATPAQTSPLITAPAPATTTPAPSSANSGWTSYQLVTLIVATFAALGFGSIFSSIYTARATRRRERASQVRTLQDQANVKFRAKVTALKNHVAGGPVDKAIQSPNFEGLETAIEGTQPLVEALVDELEEMTNIAETRTVQMAARVTHILPTLARQAAILPGTNCPAARQQRTAAIDAMAALSLDMSAVMRADLGLEDVRLPKPPTPNLRQRIVSKLRFRESRRLRESPDHLLRFTSKYQPLVRSPVDRDGSAPDPFVLLREWRVRNWPGNIPADAEGYRGPGEVIQLMTGSAKQLLCAAILMKKPDSPWIFAISGGQPQNTQVEIAKDAVRLVTGHRRAFSPLHVDGWRTIDGFTVYAWNATENDLTRQENIVNPAQPGGNPPTLRDLHDPANGVWVMTPDQIMTELTKAMRSNPPKDVEPSAEDQQDN